jgi:hypothetical protein
LSLRIVYLSFVILILFKLAQLQALVKDTQDKFEQGFDEQNKTAYSESAELAYEASSTVRTVTSLTQEDAVCGLTSLVKGKRIVDLAGVSY